VSKEQIIDQQWNGLRGSREPLSAPRYRSYIHNNGAHTARVHREAYLHRETGREAYLHREAGGAYTQGGMRGIYQGVPQGVSPMGVPQCVPPMGVPPMGVPQGVYP